MGVDAQMFVRVKPPLTEATVRRLAWECGECFGAERFSIDREGRYGKPRHCLSIVIRYTQDGDDIRPAKGEQLIEANLYTRYYGPDYERGDFPFLYALAEWLEIKTGGAVWYGGDSSGMIAKPFDAVERALMMRHFAAVGHRPYNGYFSTMSRNGHSLKCGFCKEPMVQYGFGGVNGTYESWTCGGCGWKQVTRDGGSTWMDKDPERAK